MPEAVVVSFTKNEVSAILSALEASLAITTVPTEDDIGIDESAERAEDKLQLKFGRRAIAKLVRAVKNIHNNRGERRRSHAVESLASSFIL